MGLGTAGGGGRGRRSPDRKEVRRGIRLAATPETSISRWEVAGRIFQKRPIRIAMQIATLSVISDGLINNKSSVEVAALFRAAGAVSKQMAASTIFYKRSSVVCGR